MVGSDSYARTTIQRRKFPELIDGGDMSSCWNDTVWGEDRTDGQKYGPEYYSARGENCPPRYDDDIFDFLKKENNEEYAYLLDCE